MKVVWMPACAAAALALNACAFQKASEPATPVSTNARLDWRDIATESDRDRIRQWRAAWVQGLAKAQNAGHGPAIAAEGVLLQPDAGVAWAEPPVGAYRCRVIKVGAKSTGLLDYVSYPAFGCRLRIENGVMSFAKLTGSQRPVGLFLPDTSRRMIFLGTLQLGDESMALRYGRDRERDMAGVVERIGERRWRLVLPYPHFESTIDILELVPAS